MLPYNEKDIRLLAEVLPNVSAQLRGPISELFATAVRLALPEAGERDPALDRDTAQLVMSQYRLLRLAGNLSSASLLGGPLHFPLSSGSLVDFCGRLCERAEPLFALQGVSLRFVPDHGCGKVAFHAAMLERALLNLLSNALKFTPQGGSVELRIACGEHFVRLTVSDTGCGIPPDRLAHLFDRYLDTDRLDAYPHGLGIGLALCRGIAQGHGGMLTAESTVGSGSSFTLSLPNRCLSDAAPPESSFDYAGGYDHVLLELSDALTYTAFLQKDLD